MYVVALTGGIGCGKTAATQVFAALGVPITDVDEISHALTAANQPILKQIAAEFGAEFIDENGALNRAKMRELVFNDDVARAKLNAILHPAIFEMAIGQLKQHANAPYQVLAIPLLFESPRYLPHVDKIVVLDCDEATQIARVMARSDLTVLQVQKIIASQTNRQIRLDSADFVIKNDGNLSDLHQKICDFHEKVIKTCILSKTIS